MNQLFLQGEPELELNKTFIVGIRTLCHAHMYEIVEGSPGDRGLISVVGGFCLKLNVS